MHPPSYATDTFHKEIPIGNAVADGIIHNMKRLPSHYAGTMELPPKATSTKCEVRCNEPELIVVIEGFKVAVITSRTAFGSDPFRKDGSPSCSPAPVCLSVIYPYLRLKMVHIPEIEATALGPVFRLRLKVGV